MKHSFVSLLLLFAASLLGANVLTAGDLTYTEPSPNPSFTIRYPGYFKVDTQQESGMQMITFSDIEDYSSSDLMLVLKMCMPVIAQLDENDEKTMVNSIVRFMETRFQTQFPGLTMSAPVKEDAPDGGSRYVSSYKKNDARGILHLYFRGECMFGVLMNADNNLRYKKLLPYVESFRTTETPAAANNSPQQDTTRTSAAGETPDLTQTFSHKGLSFRYPKDLKVEYEDDDQKGQTQVTCDFEQKEEMAIMNLTYMQSGLFSLLGDKEKLETCDESLNTMQANLSQIYNDLNMSDITTDDTYPHPNRHIDFTGRLFGVQIYGNMEVSVIGKTLVITIIQAQKEADAQALHTIRRTIEVE